MLLRIPVVGLLLSPDNKTDGLFVSVAITTSVSGEADIPQPS
jgi:hypothetical protein